MLIECKDTGLFEWTAFSAASRFRELKAFLKRNELSPYADRV